ncbi:hypothetical protein MWU65_06360 [Cellulophaga sp. F20128]|uniref:hypothetical protein n=1 Tax=Cellulophaga sp. F20128 TaxID=2926413 RepID=UPI001FF5AD51|nr:hypothetical protein [Cellulophaga sp. F20128]MCK0156794.1 hypothetical protein [Cellulophaga sp. F20128]
MSFTQRINITIPVLWLGFVLSISFMEAWLKFQAEGVTQIIGLNIGQLVFGSLNKVELFFMTILLVSNLKTKWFKRHRSLRILGIALLVILLAQTFYFLPVLDQRATLIINGKVPSASYFHYYYVFLEFLKVILLLVFSHQSITTYIRQP